MVPNELKEEINSLSLAIFKIAELVESSYLRERIEARTVDLVEACFTGNDSSLVANSAILRSLIYLASKLDFVSEHNRRVIADKLYDFEYIADSGVDEVDAEGIINSDEKEYDGGVGDIAEGDKVEEHTAPEKDIDFSDGEEEFSIEDKEKIIVREMDDELPNVGSGNVSSEVDGVILEAGGDVKSKADERRGKILETVRREGICFLRDLATSFPNYSERTLRYDLEKLISEGKVEKIGSSGPGTFYRGTGGGR